MAANRRALIRERLRSAVEESGFAVLPIGAQEPANGVWLRLLNREGLEADASGDELLYDQAFEALIFTVGSKTEEGANEALDEAVDRVIVAIEDAAWEGSEATDAGDTLCFYGARCLPESTTVDAEQGTGVALLPGFVRYSRG